jgi:hypothetical protein
VVRVIQCQSGLLNRCDFSLGQASASPHLRVDRAKVSLILAVMLAAEKPDRIAVAEEEAFQVNILVTPAEILVIRQFLLTEGKHIDLVTHRIAM